MEQLYRVKKETYRDELIRDLGELTQGEVYSLGKEYIGDIFTTHEDFYDYMDNFENVEDDLWLCDGDIQIRIERIKDND